MTEVHYNPEKLGLETVGEVDYSDGCYCFDLLTVWRRTEDGRLFYAEDSGCSCPVPFESHSLDSGSDPEKSLVPATPHEIAERIQSRLKTRLDYSMHAETDMAAANLISRLMEPKP